MMAKKVKRYEEGGITEGPNANIDDETRARAMAWLAKQQAGGDSESPEAAPTPARARPKMAKPLRRPVAVPPEAENAPMRRRMPPAPTAQEVYKDAAPYKAIRSGIDAAKRGANAFAGGTGMSYGDVTGMKKGGSVSKASSRADGIARKGKTRGKMV